MSSRSVRGHPGWWRTAVVGIVGGLLVAACGGGATSGQGQQGASGPPIKIGVLSDISASPPEGAEMQTNTDLAVAQINAAGGIHGHKLEVTYMDPANATDKAISDAQQLVQQDNVDVLLGGILSSECLGISPLAKSLGVVYMPSSGCASDVLTSKQCSSNTFRVSPEGQQTILPLTSYIVKSYGDKWGIVYPDYALGTSLLASYTAGLQAAGGQIVPSQSIKIQFNPPAPSMAPYVSQIKTDGSINGVINAEVSNDLVRVSDTMAQFNIASKLKIVGVFGKERFKGVYPDSLNGDIGQSPELSNDPNNQFDVAYHKAFRQQLAKEPAVIQNTLGGNQAVPGDLGYEAYTTMTALKEAMLKSNFTGRADTQKLIPALAHLKAPQGADFPGGAFQMDPNNHQGAQTTYIAKINGQNEQVLATIPANKLPSIGGNCHV